MLDATDLTDVPVRIPLAMLNRHGLVAGATGTGKTKTLQLLAEQLVAQGVPVFAADIKGDLSGLVGAGRAERQDRRAGRSRRPGLGRPRGFPVEFFALGGEGTGVPLRATMTAFGPTLLAKVLGLNDDPGVQSLGLVFHYADKHGLPLLDLADLRAVVQLPHLATRARPTSRSSAACRPRPPGVILRELIAFSDQGADAFFGEPEFDTTDLLRTTDDGRGLDHRCSSCPTSRTGRRCSRRS